jgi:hypothetical protein
VHRTCANASLIGCADMLKLSVHGEERKEQHLSMIVNVTER